MPRRPEHIQLRGKIYWLRVRVPDELRPVLGKLEVRRSLSTSDAAEAKRRVRIERVKVEAEFDDARRKLATSRLAQQPGAEQAFELTEEQVWTLATRWFVQQEKRNTERVFNGSDEEEENRFAALDFAESWDNISSSVVEEGRKLLAAAGLPDTSKLGTEWRRRLNRALHAAMIESERRLTNRMTGRNIMALNPVFHEVSAATELKPVAISTLTLADLIKRYEQDPTRARTSRKTKDKQDAQHRLFTEVIGAKTLLTSIDREKARKLLGTVKALPASATKRFRNRRVEEIVRLAEARGLKPMSVVTANSYMSAFASLMDFAVKEHLIEKNPATSLRLPNDGIRRQNKRQPFSSSDLVEIFAAPLYTGCLNDGWGYARPGPDRPRRGRFWVPLIALYSGMRLNEICQLSEDDIVVEDGTDIILIRSDEDGIKRVKTEAGHRFVPIHPELKRIGFMEYVAAIRSGHRPKVRLFPELTVASTGYISDNFSKWYANFLDKVGIKDSRKNFHSFRHTFRDALREAEIPQDRVRELGGWSSRNTEDDYGSGTRPSTLAREITKVSYPDVNLEHLYYRTA
jgi:integrase